MCAWLNRWNVSDQTDKMMTIMIMTLFVCRVSFNIRNVRFVCIGMSSEFRRSFGIIFTNKANDSFYLHFEKKEEKQEMILCILFFFLYSCNEYWPHTIDLSDRKVFHSQTDLFWFIQWEKIKRYHFTSNLFWVFETRSE